jgi:hypothetical protein
MAVKFSKDPDATLDFSINWASELVGDDVLVAVSFVTDPGINIVSSNIYEDVYATVWLSSGIAGTTYQVDCHVTTQEGRQDDRRFYIVVKDT